MLVNVTDDKIFEISTIGFPVSLRPNLFRLSDHPLPLATTRRMNIPYVCRQRMHGSKGEHDVNSSASAPGFAKHPRYEVVIENRTERVRVCVGEHTIADTTRALLVSETRHRPVWYLPIADTDPAAFTATDTSTFCPFKGPASYWTIRAGAETLEDCAWAYQDPYLECVPLKDHVAFYTDRVVLEIDGVRDGADGPGWTE